MRLVALVVLLVLASCARTPNVTLEAAFDAVDRNDASDLAYILDAGVSANALDASGRSMLYIATGPHGGADVLELLLSRGADPDQGAGSYTPLMNASSWCSLHAVQTLVEAGATLNLKNEDGQTAKDTICAAGQGRDAVLAYLAGRGL